MATIAQFSQNLSRLANSSFLNSLLLQAIKDTEKIAISLQKQQLTEGYDSEDKEIGRYSQASENIYISEGKKSNQPKIAGQLFNFDDTGSFLKEIKLEYSNNDATFWSTDSKTPELIGKYKNIFGLDNYNLSNYVKNSLAPKFILSIKRELNIT